MIDMTLSVPFWEEQGRAPGHLTGKRARCQNRPGHGQISTKWLILMG
jgi:hypothetical protein